VIPSLILLTASLGVADNGPSPYSKADLARIEVEKQWLVGQIMVIGNTRTRDSIILKRLPFCPGMRITVRDLRTAEDNLARTKLFKGFPTLRILEEDADNPYKTILVNVEERYPDYRWNGGVMWMEDHVIDGAAAGFSLVLPTDPAVSVCECLEEWPVYKAQSGCQAMVDETQGVIFVVIVLPWSQVFELHQSVGQVIRSCFPEAAEQIPANLYGGNRLPAALQSAKR
jgi:hypothetical protein